MSNSEPGTGNSELVTVKDKAGALEGVRFPYYLHKHESLEVGFDSTIKFRHTTLNFKLSNALKFFGMMGRYKGNKLSLELDSIITE